MDKIHIRDLELFLNHGVYPEETALGQKFVFDVTLFLETREAGKTDDLTKSVNYGEASARIKEFMEAHTYQLIEAAAEHVCRMLLLTYPMGEKVHLELKKPWAPVKLPLKTVSVEIERGWHRAYVAVGSNMGDREATIRSAIRELNQEEDIEVRKVSSLIRTAPYGGVAEGEFLNGAVELRTLLTPEELLAVLNRIEADHGRERTVHWGSRTLDLDILFYDREVIDTEKLHIPHIDMQNRDFVLNPMMELAPWLRHPVLNQTIAQMKGELDGRTEKLAGQD